MCFGLPHCAREKSKPCMRCSLRQECQEQCVKVLRDCIKSGMSKGEAGDMMVLISGKSSPFFTTVQMNRMEREGSIPELISGKILKSIDLFDEIIGGNNPFEPESSYYYITRILITDGSFRLTATINLMHQSRTPRISKAIVARHIKATVEQLENEGVIEQTSTQPISYSLMEIL